MSTASDLLTKINQAIDGMTEHNTQVRTTLNTINTNINNAMTKYYQIHHTPYAVLGFPNEVSYHENLVASTINNRVHPNVSAPTGVTLMRRSAYAVIRGDLPHNSTIRFDSNKFAYLFINGQEYTGNYTAHLENATGYEKVTVLVFQTAYNAELRDWGQLVIEADDFPIENAEIFVNVGSVYPYTQPDVTDILETDSCLSLYVNGNYSWHTSKYCPIRTLSVTGLLLMTNKYNCPNLEKLIVPNTSNIYKKNGGTSSIRYVDMSNISGNIEDSAFEGSAIHGIYTINNSGSIGQNAFNGCTGLTRVTIGNSVTSIGNSAFNGCTGLTSVTIGNSVTIIGNSAFNGCTGLTSVTIGNSVTSIGQNAFNGCTGLTSVSVSSNYHCSITYLQYSNVLDWRCFKNILTNCANMNENGRTSAALTFKVHSAVRTALTTAYNNGDEDAVAIYALMSSSNKNISITT